MHLLELNLFSGFQLLNQRGETLSGMSRKAKALLAWLALNPNQEYPREKLAGILWPDSSEAQARHSLRQALSSLRKILPADSSFLQATKDWIMLDSNQIQLDVQRFDKALKIADAESLDEAIQLYQGALLEGCNPKSDSFDDWLFNYRNNYQELAISAINKRLAMLLDTDFSKDSDYEMVIHYANQLIKIDELQEPAYQALMLAYNKLGNHSAALKAYETIKDKLQQQLDISPANGTEKLYKEIIAPHIIDKQTDSAAITKQALLATQKRRLSNSGERLLYQVDMAINAIVEHGIGHSFLIRGEQKKTSSIAKEIVKQIRERKFIYCRKEISTDPDKQGILVELLEVLTIYLTDPERLASLKSDKSISLRALSMLKRISADQPIMVLVEQIQNSDIDLLVQLADLASLIGDHAVLLIMLGDTDNSDPLEIIWQSAMIGAPITTIDI
jgi:DNA-binding SARP family transcriptional activator